MNEYLDILDRSGKPLGRSEQKSNVHLKGFYHNTVHIWYYTKEGLILLQQRAASKSIYPLLWDVSVAGHVDAGETIEQAAIRETGEEIGLKISEKDLQKIGVFECFQSYKSGIIDNEFHHTYISELKVGLGSLTFNPSEVEALKLIDFDTFRTHLRFKKSDNNFIESNKAYYEKVLNSIILTTLAP